MPTVQTLMDHSTAPVNLVTQEMESRVSVNAKKVILTYRLKIFSARPGTLSLFPIILLPLIAAPLASKKLRATTLYFSHRVVLLNEKHE